MATARSRASVRLQPAGADGDRLHRETETSRSKRDGRRLEEDRRMFHRIWPAPIAGVLASLFTRIGY